MMEYVTQCVDDRTGLTLVLSEVSYNQAMDWLHRKAEKYFKEVFRCESIDTVRKVISVGTPKHDFDFNGNPTVWYANIIKFYYDEERGLLMQD